MRYRLLGHELGDARYVLDREPDFIQFGGPAGTAKGRGGLGLQFERDPRFRRHYKVVGFEGDQPHTFRGLLFVRHHSPRVGVTQDADRIEVPGFLFAAARRHSAKLDEDGRIGARLGKGEARFEALELPAGRWTASVEATGRVKLTLRRDGRPLPDEGFEHPGGPVDLALAGRGAHVRGGDPPSSVSRAAAQNNRQPRFTPR